MRIGLVKKTGSLFIGNGRPFNGPTPGSRVEIIDEEGHPIFGKRYKIHGFDDWFEANCFEEIGEEL